MYQLVFELFPRGIFPKLTPTELTLYIVHMIWTLMFPLEDHIRFNHTLLYTSLYPLLSTSMIRHYSSSIMPVQAKKII